MTMLHILGLTAAAVLVAATSAGSNGLRRRGADLPLTGHIIGWSLMLGNAASLLSAAPTWYRIAMIALTVAGIVWFLVSVASRPVPRITPDVELAARDIYAGRVPTRPRPALRVVQATVVEDEPAHMPHPSLTGGTDLTVADQATFGAYGPTGGAATTGPTYVAANIVDYVDAARTRRAHGRHVARTHTHEDPTRRFLRLAEAYSVDRGPRSLGRSHLS